MLAWNRTSRPGIKPGTTSWGAATLPLRHSGGLPNTGYFKYFNPCYLCISVYYYQFILFIPWRYSLLKARALPIYLTSTCPQTKVNDHLVILRLTCDQHARVPNLRLFSRQRLLPKLLTMLGWHRSYTLVKYSPPKGIKPPRRTAVLIPGIRL